MKNVIDNRDLLWYSKNVQTSSAVSGTVETRKGGFQFLGLTQPECSTNRKAWTALEGRNNTRAFLLPENVQTSRRLRMAHIFQNPSSVFSTGFHYA